MNHRCFAVFSASSPFVILKVNNAKISILSTHTNIFIKTKKQSRNAQTTVGVRPFLELVPPSL
jgi:hypothetical protein